MLRALVVLWGAFLVWPIGTAPFVAYATNLTARNEAVSATGPMVVGRVMYRGPVPAPIEVPVDRDHEVCGHVMTVTTLSVDVATRGVRDAIVHVGLGAAMADHVPANISVLQNEHCAFSPHVAAVLAGTETEIRNSDPLMHNTNIALNNRTVLNVALVPGGHRLESH